MDVVQNGPTGAVQSREALQTSIREAAAKTQELQRQAEVAQTSLEDATASVQELHRHAAAAAQMIQAYQEQEAVIAGALHDAEQAGEQIIESAKRTVEEIMSAAEDAAEAMVQSARQTAAETLEQARTAAQEQIHGAERVAAEQISRLRADADRRLAEANQQVEEIKQRAEQYVAGITVKLEAFVLDREGVSRGLEALVKKHMESLQVIARLRSEVQSEILPTLHRLMLGLRGDGASQEDGAATQAADIPPRAPAPSPPTAEAGPAAEAVAEPRHPSATRHHAEVVVSPIHSFLQATKFMAALVQVKGVASVKLRTYAGSKAVIDIVTDGPTVAGIDSSLIDGFLVEVVESTDRRLTLRIGTAAARPVVG